MAALTSALCSTKPLQRATAPSQQAGRRTTVVVSAQQQRQQGPLAAGAGALAAALLLVSGPAVAELNKFEYNAGGEFGNGTALQYGEADVHGRDFSKQNLQRSNFTAADCRDADFSGAQLQAAYFMKSVLAHANMEGADLSDTLMDRSVIVQANLKNAILQRAILTRSDLTGSEITGADFTNALVDRSQQIALCKYADGINPTTGVDTRTSLGCGSSRRFKASSPSNPEGPQVSQEEKDAFNASTPIYRQ